MSNYNKAIYPFLLVALLLPAAAQAECSKEPLSIRTVAKDGSVIILDNGTSWYVDSKDTANARIWLHAESVTICDNMTLKNISSGSAVQVSKR